MNDGIKKQPDSDNRHDRFALSNARPAIAPGKRTATSNLPGRASASAVQRRRDSAAEANQMKWAAETSRGMDTVMRPDLYGQPVQRAGTGGHDDASSVHEAAQRGINDSGGSLPHLDRIQNAFGSHDVSGVKAHVGGAAQEATQAMGASAYATGNDVAFGQSPELFTAAHEAAHVVQQRSGVQLGDGVGREGDQYERHADAVADKVVKGESAESLLGPGADPGGASAVQRVVAVGDERKADPAVAWNEIREHEAITALEDEQQTQAREILVTWINADATAISPWNVSENRSYDEIEHLAIAVAGEVRSAANLQHEGDLAQGAYDSEHINGQIGAFMGVLQTWHNAQTEEFRAASSELTGRYSYYYSSLWDMLFGGTSVGAAVAAPPGDLNGRIALAADYALRMRQRIRNVLGEWDMRMPADADAARKTHWNPDEASDWVVDARANDIPLSAGPSATTAQLLTLAESVGATGQQKEALAWGIFAFFNKGLKRHKSGTHRFHEVMAVAAGYGVPYDQWAYGDVPVAQEDD